MKNLQNPLVEQTAFVIINEVKVYFEYRDLVKIVENFRKFKTLFFAIDPDGEMVVYTIKPYIYDTNVFSGWRMNNIVELNCSDLESLGFAMVEFQDDEEWKTTLTEINLLTLIDKMS